MASQARSTALDALIEPDADLTCLGSGYEFTEGPVWVAAERCLYFSDIPGDTRRCCSESAGMEIAARPTFKGNGKALDNQGRLLVCEQVSSCLARFRPGGERELVAFHYRGKHLNSP